MYRLGLSIGLSLAAWGIFSATSLSAQSRPSAMAGDKCTCVCDDTGQLEKTQSKRRDNCTCICEKGEQLSQPGAKSTQDPVDKKNDDGVPEGLPQSRERSGFLFRAGLGFGFQHLDTSVSRSIESNDFSISTRSDYSASIAYEGLHLSSLLHIGAFLSNAFGLHLTLGLGKTLIHEGSGSVTTRTSSSKTRGSDYKIDSFNSSDGSATMFAVGPGFTWFLSDNGWHLGLSALLYGVELDDPSGGYPMQYGVGGELLFGKDWKLDEHWGLGGALKTDFAHIDDDLEVPTAFTCALLFTVAYN